MTPCTVWSPGANGQPGGSDVPTNGAAAFQGCYDDTLPCKMPGVVTQAEWDAGLTGEIKANWASSSAAEDRGATHTTLGGFLFEWVDEFWKTVETQEFCETPAPYADVATATASLKSSASTSPYYAKIRSDEKGSAKCSCKAHITCGNPSKFVQDR